MPGITFSGEVCHQSAEEASHRGNRGHGKVIPFIIGVINRCFIQIWAPPVDYLMTESSKSQFLWMKSSIPRFLDRASRENFEQKVLRSQSQQRRDRALTDFSRLDSLFARLYLYFHFQIFFTFIAFSICLFFFLWIGIFSPTCNFMVFLQFLFFFIFTGYSIVILMFSFFVFILTSGSTVMCFSIFVSDDLFVFIVLVLRFFSF
jgi:hypothetical protein